MTACGHKQTFTPSLGQVRFAWACPLRADFVAEVADESRKLRRRSAGAVAYHSLRWKRWLEAPALTPSTRLQPDLPLIPPSGRPPLAARRQPSPPYGPS